MGLAASQARLLVLTARKSDLEYRAQNITNRKLLLSAQTENIAMDYTRALGNRQMRFTFDFNSNDMENIDENFSINSIYGINSSFIGQYRVRLADGRIAVSDVSQLPYTIGQNEDGSYFAVPKVSSTTPESVYAAYSNLSTPEKLNYLSEAITNIKTIYDTADEATKEASGYSKLVTAEGVDVEKRGDLLNSYMSGIFAAASTGGKIAKPALTPTHVDTESTADVKPTVVTEFKAEHWNNLSDANKAAYKKWLKTLINDTITGTGSTTKDSLPPSLRDALKAAKKSDGTTAMFGAEGKMSADPTDEECIAAINVLNKFLFDNKDTKSTYPEGVTEASATVAQKEAKKVGEWLEGLRTPGTVAQEAALEGTMTKMDYLAGLASGFAEALKDASSLSKLEEQDGYKLLKAYLDNHANEAFNLIYNNSTFAQRVNTEAATVQVRQGTGANGSQTSELSVTTASGETYVVLPSLKNTEFFQNAVREGSLIIEKYSADYGHKGSWNTVNWAASDIIQDKLYTEDDAAAEAEYETKTAIIQHQDKMLDVELRQIETQQKACDNEYESVKKILDKNIERSFKVFS